MARHITTRLAVLCDFDGTISKGDIGNTLFREFVGGSEWEELIASWERGEIGSRECLVTECSLATVTRDEIVSLAEGFEIDEHFTEFAAWCSENEIPLAVVSDGLDFYIELVLKKYGLSSLPVYANHLTFTDGGIVPEFPYFEQGCGRCGNCKGYHVRRYREQFGRVAFVGDGYSDRCALEEADLVLAKKGLAQLCQSLDAPCIEVSDFKSVKAVVDAFSRGLDVRYMH